MWIERTKQQYLERKANLDRIKQERAEREELRRKMQEERERKQKAYEEQQERKRQEQAKKQREWEQKELRRVEKHPYTADMEMCDFLINFCAKTAKEFSTDVAETAEPTTSQATEDTQKRIADFMLQGKLEEFERNKPAVQSAQQKKQQLRQDKRKPQPGQTLYVYEDDSRIELDYVLVKKFGTLSISPPVDAAELASTQETLRSLKAALKLKGSVEILENKARLLKDDSWVKGAEFEKLMGELNGLNREMARTLDAIKRNKMDWAQDAMEDGVNVDDELSDEEIGERLTKLRPERASGRDNREMRSGGARGEQRVRARNPRDEREEAQPRKSG